MKRPVAISVASLLAVFLVLALAAWLLNGSQDDWYSSSVAPVLRDYELADAEVEQVDGYLYVYVALPDSIDSELLQKDFRNRSGWSLSHPSNNLPDADEYPGWFLPARIESLPWSFSHDVSQTTVWYDNQLRALLFNVKIRQFVAP